MWQRSESGGREYGESCSGLKSLATESQRHRGRTEKIKNVFPIHMSFSVQALCLCDSVANFECHHASPRNEITTSIILTPMNGVTTPPMPHTSRLRRSSASAPIGRYFTPF